jgi:hypothetical protein
MRNLVSKLVLAIGLAGAVAGCAGSATYSSRGGYVAVRSAPPAPVEVYYEDRPGYVWLEGRWVWDGYDWRWREGRYVRARPGFVYHQGYWDLRGSSWVWIDGRWERDRPGYVYSRGYWDRRGGRLVYRPGRWVRTRPNQVWIEGRWIHRDGRRVYRPGRWSTRPDRPRVRDHRRRHY